MGSFLILGSAEDPATACEASPPTAPGISASNLTSTEVDADLRGLGPITAKEDFSLESRPFLTAVFEAMNCSENDYLVLFGLCLLRAIQANEGISVVIVLFR